MLVLSTASVLVSPTSQNTPGILFLSLSAGERSSCHAGPPQIAVGESALTLFNQTQEHFPRGLVQAQHNQIFTEAQILKSTS